MPNIEFILQTNKIEAHSMIEGAACWRMLYLSEGDITATLNNSVYRLNQNSVLIISPDDFYFINENRSSNYTVLNFKAPKAYTDSKALSLEYSEAQLLNSLISSQVLTEKQAMLELFLILTDKKESNADVFVNQKNRLYTKAVGLMERYLTSSLTVDELADMLNISLSGLKRLFLRLTGIGVHQYFLMLKINKAKAILLSGDTVTHTAKLLQFSSQTYFSATFKRVTGISAKAYSISKLKSAPKKHRAYNKTAAPTTEHPKRLPDYLL